LSESSTVTLEVEKTASVGVYIALLRRVHGSLPAVNETA